MCAHTHACTHTYRNPILSCLTGIQWHLGSSLVLFRRRGCLFPSPMITVQGSQWVSLCLLWLFCWRRREGLRVGPNGLTWKSGSGGRRHHWFYPALPSYTLLLAQNRHNTSSPCSWQLIVATLPPPGSGLCCWVSVGGNTLPPMLDMPSGTFVTPVPAVCLHCGGWQV